MDVKTKSPSEEGQGKLTLREYLSLIREAVYDKHTVEIEVMQAQALAGPDMDRHRYYFYCVAEGSVYIDAQGYVVDKDNDESCACKLSVHFKGLDA